MIPFIFSLLFAVFSHWQVFENDFFWQARYGEEIVKNADFQTNDSWSHTAFGAPWYNYYWLSCVLFYGVTQVGENYFFVPTLRSGLVFLIFFLTSQLVLYLTHDHKKNVLYLFIILPAFFISTSGRFQMRPDLLGTLCFVILLYLSFHKKQKKYQIPIMVLILVFWANAHGGTFPIGYSLYLFGLLFGETGKNLNSIKKFLWSICGFTSWFITPIGFHILKMVYWITVEYDWTVIMNPDHMPFTLSLLHPRYRAVFCLWGIAAVLFFAALIKLKRFLDLKQFFLVFGMILVLLTFAKIRTRVYSFLFFIPLLCIWFNQLDFSKKITKIIFGAVSLILWGVLLPLYLKDAPTYGFGVNESAFPVRAVAFLKEIQAEKNLLNHYDYGGYLIGNLRNLSVSHDGREIIYGEFLKKLANAKKNPVDFSDFLKKFKINTVLSKPVSTDQIEFWYPSTEWNLAFTDQTAFVFLRKTPIY